MENSNKCKIKSLKKTDKICGINYAQKILSGKWKISIIWFLKKGEKRYSEIKKFLFDISQGSLTKQLRELEDDEIIDTEVSEESNSVAEEFGGENDYDEDDTATLEGEEGEETTDEDNEEFNDVEMGSDENFEEN